MGRGRRWADVQRLAAATGVPALVTESPRGVNDPALRGAAASLAEADLVLLLGKALDFALRFGQSPAFRPDCRFLQVVAEPGLKQRDDRLTLALTADPAVVVSRLVDAAATRAWSRSSWADDVAAAHRAVPAAWDALRAAERSPMHPVRVCAAVQRHLDGRGVLVADGGEFGQWAQACLVAGERLINGLSGSIGSALPMALAARLARPDAPVFALLGDGTFGFHALEIDTAVRYRLPFVAVVGNDARWNAEYQLQVRHYGRERTVGCELLPTRYDRLAEALGGHGEWVDRPEALDGALVAAVGSGRPACVNVLIEGAAAPTFRQPGSAK
jgi:acetolactate synthase-1/2/3 large subunit